MPELVRRERFLQEGTPLATVEHIISPRRQPVRRSLRNPNIRLPFLRKPFVSSVLREKVRAVLDGRPAQPQEL